MMEKLKINFGCYKINPDMQSEPRFKFRWLVAPLKAMHKREGGVVVDPSQIRLPAPGDHYTIEFLEKKSNCSFEVIHTVANIQSDDEWRFALFQLGNVPAVDPSDMPDADDKRITRKTFTAKEILGDFYAQYDPTSIRAKARTLFERQLKAFTANSDIKRLSKDTEFDSFFDDVYTLISEHYEGPESLPSTNPQRPLTNFLPAEFFAARFARLVRRHFGMALNTKEHTAPLAAAVARIVTPTDAACNALKNLVFAVASGITLEVTKKSGNTTIAKTFPIGTLLGLEYVIDTSAPEHAPLRDLQGRLKRLHARLTWYRANGPNLEMPTNNYIENVFQQPLQSTEITMPKAWFVEDAFFTQKINVSSINPWDPRPYLKLSELQSQMLAEDKGELIYKPTCGDGLVSITVEGIATPGAQYTSFVVVRGENPDQPPGVEQAEPATPVVPQDQTDFTTDQFHRYGPPTSPGPVVKRGHPVISYHRIYHADAKQPYNEDGTANIIPENTADRLYERQQEVGSPTSEILKEDRWALLGHVNYFWIYVRSLGGEWLSVEEGGVRRPLAIPVRRRPDYSVLRLPDELSTSSDRERQAIPKESPDAMPFLSAESPDAPPLRESDQDGPTEALQLTLVSNPNNNALPQMLSASVSIFDANMPAATENGVMPRYTEWFCIEELHVLLFQRIPKVEIEQPIHRAGLDARNDIDYYRAQPWFQRFLDDDWGFVGLSRHERESWRRNGDHINLEFTDDNGEIRLVNTGYEYQAVIIAKRMPGSCYQVPEDQWFPVVRVETEKPEMAAASKEDPPATRRFNNVANGRYLHIGKRDHVVPLRFEFSEPAVTELRYQPPSSLPDAPRFTHVPTVSATPRPIVFESFATTPLPHVEGLQTDDVLKVLVDAPSNITSENLQWFRSAFIDGMLDRTRSVTGESAIAKDAKTLFSSWLTRNLTPKDVVDSDSRRARIASVLATRGFVAVRDPNVSATPTDNGIPIVGARWSRITRSEYSDFERLTQLNYSEATLTAAHQLDAFVKPADSVQPFFVEGPILLQLLIPGRRSEVSDESMRPPQTYRQLVEGDVAKQARDGKIDYTVLPNAPALFEPERIWGTVHWGTRFRRDKRRIQFNPPLHLDGNAEHRTIGAVLVLELTESTDSLSWHRTLAEIDVDDVQDDQLMSLRILTDHTTADLPNNGLVRVSFAKERVIRTVRYGRNQSDLNGSSRADTSESGLWISVIEPGQEDKIGYVARFVVPGRPEKDSNRVLSSAGPAGCQLIRFASSVTPPTPRIKDIRPEQWNIRFKWSTDYVADENGHRELLYDMTNWFEFRLGVRQNDPRATQRKDGSRSLFSILSQIRHGRWSPLSEDDKKKIRSWLGGCLDRTEESITDTSETLVFRRSADLVLSGTICLASDNQRHPLDLDTTLPYLLESPTDVRRRDNYQWRFQVRALENTDFNGTPTDYTLMSEWTPVSDWIRPLPIKPILSNHFLLRDLLEADEPQNVVRLRYIATNRSLGEFYEGTEVLSRRYIDYELAVWKDVAIPERTAGGTTFMTVRQPNRLLSMRSISDEGGQVIVSFEFRDFAVAPRNTTSQNYTYVFQLCQVEICADQQNNRIVVARSEPYKISIMPQSEIQIDGFEPLFNPSQPSTRPTVEGNHRLSLVDRLTTLGWRQDGSGNVFAKTFPKGQQATVAPFVGQLIDHRISGLIVELADESPYSVALIENADYVLDPDKLTILPKGTVRLYLA